MGISGSYEMCVLKETTVLFSPPAATSFSDSISSSAILRYVVASHSAFNFHFPNDQWCWTVFHGLFAICISSSETCLFNFVCPFINHSVHLLAFEFWRLFLYVGCKFFVRYMICKHCLLVSSWFSFTWRYLWQSKSILMKFNLPLFVQFMLLVSYLRTLWRGTVHADFPPLSSL